MGDEEKMDDKKKTVDLFISISSLRLGIIAFAFIVAIMIVFFHSLKEVNVFLTEQIRLEDQKKICTLVESELEQSIRTLYGAKQYFLLPGEVVQGFRARVLSSGKFGSKEVQAFDEALFSCSARSQYRKLVDRIYYLVYPNKFLSI